MDYWPSRWKTSSWWNQKIRQIADSIGQKIVGGLMYLLERNSCSLSNFFYGGDIDEVKGEISHSGRGHWIKKVADYILMTFHKHLLLVYLFASLSVILSVILFVWAVLQLRLGLVLQATKSVSNCAKIEAMLLKREHSLNSL